jgi:hypothetical protein
MCPRPFRLALLLAAGLALAPPARAVDVQSDVAVQSNKSVGDYLADLSSSEDPDRLFAARVLLGELKRNLRIVERARPDSIAHLDAQALLVELEDRLPRGCATAVRFKNTTAACADIFALLGDPTALPALREVLAGETRKGVRKHLEAAIATLAPFESALAPDARAPADPAAIVPPAPALPPGVPSPDPPPTTSPTPAPGGP